MTTTPQRARTLAALVTGLGTVAYYATPDVIASRTARGWTKAGLTTLMLASSVPEFLAVRAEMQEKKEAAAPHAPDAAADATPPSLDDVKDPSTSGEVAIGGAVVAVLTAYVVTLVLAEKWVFRRGEARAAAGKALAHTRPALVYGAIAAGLALVPLPKDAE